jgi:shikimate dehydrogenase
LNKKTDFQLFGIFGHPLAHTLSPAMQEAGFAAAGIKAYYLVFDFDLSQFKQSMKGLHQFPLQGFNLTVPYKQTIAPFLDELSAEAKAVGAVNTVFRKGKKWIGTNTDVFGFQVSLKKDGKFQPRGKKALVIGAGGAARAVVYGLCEEEIKILTISNRHKDRAQKMILEFRKKFPRVQFEIIPFENAHLKHALQRSDLVVNATSVGLKPNEKLFSASLIPKRSQKNILFVDLIYRPAETPFLKAAKEKGQKTLNGIGMLLYQGARAFEIWTSKKAPVDVMRKALFLSSKSAGANL